MLEVYGAQWCTYCKQLKDYLDTNKIEHEFIDIDTDIEESVVLLDMNLVTIPQVFEGDGKLIGGHDDTIEYLESLKALRKDLES